MDLFNKRLRALVNDITLVCSDGLVPCNSTMMRAQMPWFAKTFPTNHDVPADARVDFKHATCGVATLLVGVYQLNMDPFSIIAPRPPRARVIMACKLFETLVYMQDTELASLVYAVIRAYAVNECSMHVCDVCMESDLVELRGVAHTAARHMRDTHLVGSLTCVVCKTRTWERFYLDFERPRPCYVTVNKTHTQCQMGCTGTTQSYVENGVDATGADVARVSRFVVSVAKK